MLKPGQIYEISNSEFIGRMPIKTELEVMPREYDGPFIQKHKARTASDGTPIVPFLYVFHKTRHYSIYEWRVDDPTACLPVYHNPDGIASIKWYLHTTHNQIGMLDISIYNSKVRNIEYIVNNKLHRKNGPARIINNHSETWFKEDQEHRLDGPCNYSLHFGRDQSFKYWKVDGIYHRINGPAQIDIKGKGLTYSKIKKRYKQRWIFMGEPIPKHIIRFENGKPWQHPQDLPFDKKSIMDAMFFNRRYGKIVQAIYSMNRMVSEAEAYKMITGNDW